MVSEMRRRRGSKLNQKAVSDNPGLIELVALVGLSCIFIGSVYYTFSVGNHAKPDTHQASSKWRSDDAFKASNIAQLENGKKTKTGDDNFRCEKIDVTDGDTFKCGDQRIRLAGIDAPELPGHCRKGRVCAPGDPVASRNALASLLVHQPVLCLEIDIDRYGRTIASCEAGGVNLSCALVRSGNAVQRYGGYPC